MNIYTNNRINYSIKFYLIVSIFIILQKKNNTYITNKYYILSIKDNFINCLFVKYNKCCSIFIC